MKPIPAVLSRAAGMVLAVSMALPSPVYALRSTEIAQAPPMLAGLEESLGKTKRSSTPHVTTGLEEDAKEAQTRKRLDEGWRSIRQGQEGDAVKSWGRLVESGKVAILYGSIEERFRKTRARSSRRTVGELQMAMKVIQYVLNDPILVSSLKGDALQQSWRERFMELSVRVAGQAKEFTPSQLQWLEQKLAEAPNDGARCGLLRGLAGYASQHRLEKAAGVAWGTVSRFEQDRRGVGLYVGTRVRQVLEKRTGLALTLSFRLLRIPLAKSVNPLPSPDARLAFIKNEILGWAHDRLPRIVGPSFERARHRIRRATRDALEQGLSDRLKTPVRLDGQLQVMTASVAEGLQALPNTGSRLHWLLEDLLILSRTSFFRRAGFKGSRASLTSSQLISAHRRVPQDWKRARRLLEKELALRAEHLHLDPRLLPQPEPADETVEELLEILLSRQTSRWNFLVRNGIRKELKGRFLKPSSRDPNAQLVQRASILMGFIEEVRRLYQGRAILDRLPSKMGRLVTVQGLIRWITGDAAFPLVRRTLQAIAKNPGGFFPRDPDPERKLRQLRETLAWFVEASRAVRLSRSVTGRLEKLLAADLKEWDSAGLEEVTRAQTERLLDLIMKFLRPKSLEFDLLHGEEHRQLQREQRSQSTFRHLRMLKAQRGESDVPSGMPRSTYERLRTLIEPIRTRAALYRKRKITWENLRRLSGFILYYVARGGIEKPLHPKIMEEDLRRFTDSDFWDSSGNGSIPSNQRRVLRGALKSFPEFNLRFLGTSGKISPRAFQRAFDDIEKAVRALPPASKGAGRSMKPALTSRKLIQKISEKPLPEENRRRWLDLSQRLVERLIQEAPNGENQSVGPATRIRILDDGPEQGRLEKMESGFVFKPELGHAVYEEDTVLTLRDLQRRLQSVSLALVVHQVDARARRASVQGSFDRQVLRGGRILLRFMDPRAERDGEIGRRLRHLEKFLAQPSLQRYFQKPPASPATGLEESGRLVADLIVKSPDATRVNYYAAPESPRAGWFRQKGRIAGIAVESAATAEFFLLLRQILDHVRGPADGPLNDLRLQQVASGLEELA